MEDILPISTLFSLPNLISLLTLTLMEVILGVDNIIFISIMASKLPLALQTKARNWGLVLAFFPRLLLILFISWIAGLTEPIVAIASITVSGRDFILLGGGLFLIAKSTLEIHGKLEGEDATGQKVIAPSFARTVFQMTLLNLIFSFDSVITAVGLVDQIWIMVLAIIISMIVMFIFAGYLHNIILKHPTIKMLALAFLLMIGTLLFAEGLHVHVPKGYVYFAMAFSVFVEVLNMRIRVGGTPVKLKEEMKEG